MNAAHQQALTEIGLTKNESKVYLALLKLGPTTAIEITKLSKVHRVNVYDALERLREKSLLSSIMQSNKRIFEAANPQLLSQILEQKQALLDDMLPQLTEEFKSKSEKQVVHHFFGPEGVIRAYYMMLDQNETYYAISGSGLNRKYLRHRHHMWDKKRLEKKTRIKGIYYESARSMTDKVGGRTLIERRFIPDTYKSIGMIDICGSLVTNLLPIENNIMAIVIENRLLADTYRNIHKFMWGFAKK